MRAHRDLDDVLRRALHAAVDQIEPVDDGLTRILHRLTAPWVMRYVSLLVTDCVDLARLITIWLEPAYTRAMRHRWPHHTGYRRRISRQSVRMLLRPAVPWLRPALAVVGAAAIVVIGAVVVGQARQIVTRTSLNADTSTTGPTHAGAQSAGGGHGRSPKTSLTRAGSNRPGIMPGQGGRTTDRPSCAATSCPPSARTASVPSPAIGPSGPPTAVPSQNPGPTPTPSKTNHGHHQPHPSPANSAPPGHKGHAGS